MLAAPALMVFRLTRVLTHECRRKPPDRRMTAEAQGLPRKHPHAAARVYEGEAFIVLPQFHQYKILNEVGTRIWDLIDGKTSQEEIAKVISQEYEVAFETALDDVKQFLADLQANGMLVGEESVR